MGANRPPMVELPGWLATLAHMRNPASAVFDSIIDDIRKGYGRCKPRLGWRFLYTPRRTFRPDIGIAVVALNPGGGNYAAPSPSFEEGNAFRLENWRRGPGPKGPNPLQKQVRALFTLIAAAHGDQNVDRLLDESLVANLCPYRSSSWAKLEPKSRSLEVSKGIWRRAFSIIRPKVLITLGSIVAREVRNLNPDWFGKGCGVRAIATGWGSTRCTVSQAPRGGPLVIELPHLSRFKVFGREAGQAFERQLSTAVGTALSR